VRSGLAPRWSAPSWRPARIPRGLRSATGWVIGVSIGLVGRTRPDLVTQRRTELWDLLAADRLNLKYIDLPLGEITKAIDLVPTRSNLGRVVLRTR
jgi:hypothetical protein